VSNGARVLAIMVAAAVLALIGGVIYALWLIGAETARVLAFLLLGLATAIVLVVLAAWLA